MPGDAASRVVRDRTATRVAALSVALVALGVAVRFPAGARARAARPGVV